jgi:cation transport regulator ChaB
MSYDQVSEIYLKIEATEIDLRFDLYRAALRYASLRSEWYLASREERKDMEARRTAAHNVVIDALIILVRNSSKQGQDVSWRSSIGDDRKEIGDFAVFLAAHLAILAR